MSNEFRAFCNDDSGGHRHRVWPHCGARLRGRYRRPDEHGQLVEHLIRDGLELHVQCGQRWVIERLCGRWMGTYLEGSPRHRGQPSRSKSGTLTATVTMLTE